VWSLIGIIFSWQHCAESHVEPFCRDSSREFFLTCLDLLRNHAEMTSDAEVLERLLSLLRDAFGCAAGEKNPLEERERGELRRALCE